MSDALPKRAPVAVLLGGGVESTAIVKRCLGDGDTVVPIHVQCGLIWDASEAWHVRRFCDRHASPRLQPLVETRMPLHDFLAGHWAITGTGVPQAGDATARLEIPMRNLTLLSVAMHQVKHLARFSLALGTTADNCFRDGSREYFDRCEDVLSLEAGFPVQILTPFIRVNKTQVIRETDAETLALSFSCVDPRDQQHCGCCIKCGRRQAAFAAAGVPDPTVYATRPRSGDRGYV